MNTNRPSGIAVIGECMLEMSRADQRVYRLAFAGDTYNVAVYLKRALLDKQIAVEYVTALGNDLYSQQMIAAWHEEGVESHWVRHFDDKLPGLYTIETDEAGERNFYYYRSSAAVRELFKGAEGQALAEQLLQFDTLFLSGITLAVLHQDSRETLLKTIARAHSKGCRICFDSNYRARLWESAAVARETITALLPYVSLGLPSFNDAQALFNDTAAEQTASRWHAAGVPQVVVKLGEQGYGLYDEDGYRHVPVTPVKQVDTTAAGDSFDGTLLAGLLNGDTLELAAARASQVAAKVVAHHGAIIAADLL